MKKLIIIVPVLIVLIAALGWYGYTKRSGTAADIEGRWALSSGDTGCYTTVRFVANPATSGGAVSIEETSGNVVQMSYGNYSTGKNQSLEVQLTNRKLLLSPSRRKGRMRFLPFSMIFKALRPPVLIK